MCPRKPSKVLRTYTIANTRSGALENILYAAMYADIAKYSLVAAEKQFFIFSAKALIT